MSDQFNIPDDILSNVRDIIREIEEKSASGDYIYRGEPEHHEEPPYYGKICSSLYRQYAWVEADEFDIEIVHEEILAEAETYSHETDDPFEILTQLQHYGGKTNLIDFTTDHLIALFFACDRSDSLKEDGRLILFKRNEDLKDLILIPRNPRNRVIAQKSVFVQHPDGFLSLDDVEIITIPARLKQPLLIYLRKYHGISTESIYNDLHGFIINQRFHENAYLEFHRGLTSQLKGDEAETSEEKQAAYQKAVMHYSRALKLKPDLPDALIHRGVAYFELGDFSSALADFSKMIELDPENADVYAIRGDAYFGKGDFDLALSDFNKVIELNSSDPDAFIYQGNAYLEQGDFDLALTDFSKAVELNPNYADAYIIRGVAYRKQGNFSLALVDLDKAIELNPNNANAYVIRGDAYFGKGDFNLAMEDYRKAIELNPKDAEAYYNLGLVWMQRQNWQEAKLNLTVAKILEADIVSKFHDAYESIADFEQKNDINLPEYIAAMLTR